MSSREFRKAKHINPYGKIYTLLMVLFGITAMGVLGFMYIEHYSFLDALYMTIITLSTVGYQEVKPLSGPGKVFDIVLIMTNLLVLTFFISTITRYFLDGEFSQHIKLINMDRSISNLSGHMILCGYGRNGHAAANVLRQNNVPFVVVERSLQDKKELEYYVEGDATDEDILVDAGIHKATALIITLPEDAANLYIVLSARQLNSHIRIICRASDQQAVKKMKIAGADNVVMPDKIGGTHMATLALNPDIKKFMDMLMTQSFEDTTIEELLVNRSVRLGDLDHWKATGANILGIKNDNMQYTLNPGFDHQINVGQRLIVLGSKDQIAALKALVS